MWRLVAPTFEDLFRVVLFDHVGAGGSDLSAYDPVRYADLAGSADDIVEIGHELAFRDAVFVGYSVATLMGVLAAIRCGLSLLLTASSQFRRGLVWEGTQWQP